MPSNLTKNTPAPWLLGKRLTSQDLCIALSLLVIGILTRLPFASKMLFHSDSARFALAMKHYDVSQMRPHAPGYILYVALAKLLDLFFHDEATSLVAISILAGSLAAFFLYCLATKMYGRITGLIASLLLLSSPLFWFNCEIPFTYAMEGLLSVIFASTCYKIITGDEKWVLISAIILGLATGVRQNIVIILLPLWLYSIKRYPIKQIIMAFLVFGVICFAWFIPMIALSGGLKTYFAAIDAQFKTVVLHPAPFLFQVKTRGTIFATFMLYSLTLGLIPIFYYSGRFFGIPSIAEDLRLKFLLLWFVPAIIFFIGVNVYNPGHVVLILPPLFICLAESIKGLSIDLEQGIDKIIVDSSIFLKRVFSYKIILVSSVLFLLLINFYMFFFKDTRVSYSAIRKEDRRLTELIKLTKNNFDSGKSMILTCWLNTQAGFYLPDYLIYCPLPLIFNPSEVPIEAQNVYISFRHQTTPKTYWIPTGFKIEPITISPGVDTIILWEQKIAKYYHSFRQPLKEIDSDINDIKVFYIKVTPSDKIYYDYHYLSVK